MIAVFFDTNVILDVLLARLPWFHEAATLWGACENQHIKGYLSATTVTDIYYVARRQTDRIRALTAVRLCLQTFTICAVDANTLSYALSLAGTDFEDNLQVACAIYEKCEYIITHDIDEFAWSPLQALTPTEMLRKLAI